MQAKDTIVPAGRRIGLMVMSTDRDYTVRPAPGTEVTIHPAASSVSIPVVGGERALEEATKPAE